VELELELELLEELLLELELELEEEDGAEGKMNPPSEAVGARYSMRVYSPPPMVVASRHCCACRVSGV